MHDPFPQISGRALVMDPDPARLARRCAQLTAAGWQTDRAGDPVEALSSVRRGQTDVVLLHLPTDEAEATDLPRVLRLASEAPHLPVVVLAPAPAEQMRCRFLDSGADEIAPDSVSPAELASRLRALMRVKVLQDQLRDSRAALSASLQRERALLTQLRRDNAHLLTLCATDPLTRLHNVRHFDAVLEGEFKIARRYDRRLSALALDVDHFKLVNDTHGHPSGDYVLKEVAVILKRAVRDSDVVARTGGEEFGIVLPHTGRAQATRMAERIRREVRRRAFCVFGRRIHVTISVGSASYPEDAEVTEPHMLVYFADQALLQAKQLGRDRAVAFSDLDPDTRCRLRGQYQRSCPQAAEADPALTADARR